MQLSCHSRRSFRSTVATCSSANAPLGLVADSTNGASHAVWLDGDTRKLRFTVPDTVPMCRFRQCLVAAAEDGWWGIGA